MMLKGDEKKTDEAGCKLVETTEVLVTTEEMTTWMTTKKQ